MNGSVQGQRSPVKGIVLRALAHEVSIMGIDDFMRRRQGARVVQTSESTGEDAFAHMLEHVRPVVEGVLDKWVVGLRSLGHEPELRHDLLVTDFVGHPRLLENYSHAQHTLFLNTHGAAKGLKQPIHVIANPSTQTLSVWGLVVTDARGDRYERYGAISGKVMLSDAFEDAFDKLMDNAVESIIESSK